MSYNVVRARSAEPGKATPDVYAYLVGGKPLLLCGPCARKRTSHGERMQLASVADKLYRDDSKCADCAPKE